MPRWACSRAQRGIENGAEHKYQRAIQLNLSYDRAYVREGTLRFVLGDFTGAVRLIRQAETLNPDALALPGAAITTTSTWLGRLGAWLRTIVLSTRF
jgi:lipopolysaccharide biosynthesis regulator YciM